MRATVILSGWLFLVIAATAQDDDARLVSGPQAGTVLPGTFNFYHLNPPPIKEGVDPKEKREEKILPRFRSLVLENQHKPVMLVFVRESGKAMDPMKDESALAVFLRKLDAKVHEYWDHDYTPLRGVVIFQSAAGKASISGEKVEDPFQLVAEAEARAALEKRLLPWVEATKRLTLGYTTPDEPKSYKLNPKAELTVIYYTNLKVEANFAYAKDQFTAAAANEVLAKVEMLLKKSEKKK